MKKGIITPLILLILGLLVGGGAVYFLTQNRVQKPTSTNQVETPTESTSPSTDETANWKTYTNEKFKFSVRYPQGWSITDHSYSVQGKENIGFGIMGPIRKDVVGAQGKDAHFYTAVKWDFTKKALVQNESSPPVFVFAQKENDQAVTRIDTTKEYVAESEEYKTLDQILSTFKFAL